MTRQSWKLIFLFIGTIIGAGFASGQEIWQYFVRFGPVFLPAILLAALLFALLLSRVFGHIASLKQVDQKSFLNSLLPERWAVLTDAALNAFLFAGLTVMLSGAGELTEQYLGLPRLWGILFCSLLVWLAVAGRAEGVLSLQTFLVPPMLIIIFLVAVLSLRLQAEHGTFNLPTEGLDLPSARSAILYVSYNMASGLAVVIAAGSGIAIKKRAAWYSGLILGAIGCLVALALYGYYAILGHYEMPMLYLAYESSSALFYIYGAVLATAILTSALADCLSLTRRWHIPSPGHGLRGNWLMLQTTVLLAAIPVAFIDFSFLVDRLYGFFAILLLPLWLLLIVKRPAKHI